MSLIPIHVAQKANHAKIILWPALHSPRTPLRSAGGGVTLAEMLKLPAKAGGFNPP
jgi:hypothetical protein